MFDFGEFLWKNDPTYKRAMERVIGYFMTPLEFYDPTHTASVRDEDVNNYREVIQEQLDIKKVMHKVLVDLAVFGNAIITMLPPLKRRLQCPGCLNIHPVDAIMAPENKHYNFKYIAKGAQFTAKCDSCGYHGAWQQYTDADDYRREVKLKVWNPHEFIVHQNPFNEKSLHTWIIPARLKQQVMDGDPLILTDTPTSILEAIGENKDYRFDPDEILHLKEATLSTIDTGGWGIPPALDGYSLSRYVFSLRRMNEVLAADYMLPVRLLSPQKAPSEGYNTADTGWTVDLNDWNSDVRSVWAAHRKDPTAVHTIGTPVEYQVLGGEGKSLIPGEILSLAEDSQLNAMGFPAQMYRGDLSVQAAPMAARMFEQHWWQVHENANKLLTWVVRKLTPRLGWKAVGIRLEPPKTADNMDHLMLLMQMVTEGDVAKSTILQRLGLDQTEELRKQQDAALLRAEMEAKSQQEMDKLMAGNSALVNMVDEQRAAMQPPPEGGAAPAGAPMPAGGGAAPAGGAAPPSADPIASIMLKVEQFGNENIPTKPQDLMALAQEAAAVLANMPEIQKRQTLRDIENKSPMIKDMITQEMGNFHKQQDKEFIAQGRQAAGIM
jgi:hypothetical protein